MRAVHLHVQLYVPKDNLVGRNSDCDIAKPEIIKAVRKSINHTLTSNKCAVFILIIPDTHSWEYIRNAYLAYIVWNPWTSLCILTPKIKVRHIYSLRSCPSSSRWYRTRDFEGEFSCMRGRTFRTWSPFAAGVIFRHNRFLVRNVNMVRFFMIRRHSSLKSVIKAKK